MIPEILLTYPHAPPVRATGGHIEVDLELLDSTGALLLSDSRAADGQRLPLGVRFVTVEEMSSGSAVTLGEEHELLGSVVDENDQPVAGVLVRHTGCMGIPFAQAWPERVVARSDRSGSFRIVGLSDVENAFVIEPPSPFVSGQVLRTLPGVRHVHVRLNRGEVVTIRVLDQAGESVAGAEVILIGTVNGGGSVVQEVVTSESGVAVLTGIEAGTVSYAIRIRPPAARANLSDLRIDNWLPVDGTITLPHVLLVQGRVLDESGRPLAGALVRLRSSGTEDLVLADRAGSFTVPLGGTSESHYLSASLGAESVGVEDWSQEVAVVAGQSDVVLTVDTGRQLRVVVENLPMGTREVSATLTATQEAREHRGRLVEPRTILFRGLRSEETYDLWIQPPSEQPDLSLWRSGVVGTESRISVSLSPGVLTRGRVLLPPGASNATLTVSRGRAHASLELDGDGAFEFRGLPHGSWLFSVEAFLASSPTALTGRQVADAGADVELRVTAR
jgi:hypothetical protein